MNLPCIDEISDVTGKLVLIRVGINVSLNSEQNIEDTFRIDRVLPTIEYLQERGARIVLIGHIGREKYENFSVVFGYLKKKLNNISFHEGTFAGDDDDVLASIDTKYKELTENLSAGHILLLDNLRQSGLEKNNSLQLARALESCADYYVLEAVSVSHRRHMSVDSLARAFSIGKRYVGFNFKNEINYFEKAMMPKGPSLFVISGNKINTKLPLIKSFSEQYDQILVGGVIANTLYQQSGYFVGNSVIDDEITKEEAGDIQDILKNPKLILPKDIVVENNLGEKRITHISDIREGESIYDVIIDGLQISYSSLATVLWNGPLGLYEKGYTESTDFLAAQISKNQCVSIVGGGNTVSAIRSLGYESSVTFLSTAGGAMLDYLGNGSLVAIDALIS